jgi:hypothetical protein
MVEKGNDAMKIVGRDSLARETVADHLLIQHVPKHHLEDAQKACTFLNKFTCDNNGGYYYEVVEDNYRLSKGMEDLV